MMIPVVEWTLPFAPVWLLATAFALLAAACDVSRLKVSRLVLRRFGIALMLAGLLTVGVTAAVPLQNGCDVIEKYSWLWWLTCWP